MQGQSTYHQTDVEIEIIQALKDALEDCLEQYYVNKQYEDFIHALKEIQYCNDLLTTLKNEKKIALGEG